MYTPTSSPSVINNMSCRQDFIGFHKLDVAANIPRRMTTGSVGYDLSTKDNGETTVVPAHGKALIKIGIQ